MAASSEANGTVNGDGYISDDSSFYGDEEQKAALEGVSLVDPSTYTKFHDSLPAVLAYRNAPPPRQSPEKLHNPYADNPCAYQFTESVDEFLRRLPPSSTTFNDVGPWIWVANPHAQRISRVEEDHARLGREGEELLQEFTAFKERTEKDDKKTIATRKVKAAREKLVGDLKRLAAECNVKSGKWMLFPNSDNVNRVWAAVAHGVVNDRLGIAAKVATAGSERGTGRLICIYTADYEDQKDVKRVVEELMRMGLVDLEGRGIWYKSDAWTHLGIESGNPWDLRASLYGSVDMLKGKK